jgi:hypothetical protein
MYEGGDACVKKTAGMCGSPVRAVFFAMCAGKHRKGSDSEKLSFEPEAHQPLAELLLFLWHQRKKRVNKYI